MRLEWTEPARDDLADIRRSIHALNPRAAKRVAAAIRRAASKLRRFPMAGPQGEGDTRELVVVAYPSYSLIYVVTPSEPTAKVQILSVWKNWLPG